MEDAASLLPENGLHLEHTKENEKAILKEKTILGGDKEKQIVDQELKEQIRQTILNALQELLRKRHDLSGFVVFGSGADLLKGSIDSTFHMGSDLDLLLIYSEPVRSVEDRIRISEEVETELDAILKNLDLEIKLDIYRPHIYGIDFNEDHSFVLMNIKEVMKSMGRPEQYFIVNK